MRDVTKITDFKELSKRNFFVLFWYFHESKRDFNKSIRLYDSFFGRNRPFLRIEKNIRDLFIDFILRRIPTIFRVPTRTEKIPKEQKRFLNICQNLKLRMFFKEDPFQIRIPPKFLLGHSFSS